MSVKNTNDKSHRFECSRILFDTNTVDLMKYKRLVQIENRMDRALGNTPPSGAPKYAAPLHFALC